MRRALLLTMAAVLVTAPLAPGQERIPSAIYMRFSEAAPVLRAGAAHLPSSFRGQPETELRREWPEWEVATDRDIRRRLVEGEEDALAELLLFGTSFTDQPRAAAPDVRSAAAGRPTKVLEARLTDLLSNLADPSGNERLVFSRELILDKGLSFDSPAALARVRAYLLGLLERLRTQGQLFRDALSTAQRLSGPPRGARHTGGLVLETSLLTNYGVEQALTAMQQRRLLAPGTVRRVAIIGPGLDFVDRQSGYDTYPEQTVQPFALMDSLFRLKLASPKALHIATFDISARVNDHIQSARERAARGRPYFIQLPRPAKGDWTAGAVAYWDRFGGDIGQPATPAKLPKSAKEMTIRAVRVTPENVAAVLPLDLNIVLQKLDVPADSPPFDLIVATNILDYYDVFQQNLALRNIAAMLRPGGLLLSNTRLTQLDGAQFVLAGSTSTAYTANSSDVDYWYRRQSSVGGAQ